MIPIIIRNYVLWNSISPRSCRPDVEHPAESDLGSEDDGGHGRADGQEREEEVKVDHRQPVLVEAPGSGRKISTCK